MRELQSDGTKLISDRFKLSSTRRDLGRILLQCAIEHGVKGDLISALSKLSKDGKERLSSKFVIGSILSDMGWDWKLGPYVFLLGLAAELYAAAHALKRGERVRFPGREEEVGRISAGDRIYSLLMGVESEEIPEENSRLLNDILVACADHGATPLTTQIARLVASTCSVSGLDAATHAFGPAHSGAIQEAMKMFHRGVVLEREKGWGIKRTAKSLFDEYKQNGKMVPGFGHRYHTEDLRSIRIKELAERYGIASTYVEFANEMEDFLYEEKGIGMNADGEMEHAFWT
jgi:hypothetical protein